MSQRTPRTPRRPPYPAFPTASSQHSAFQSSDTSISSAASHTTSYSNYAYASPQQSAPLPSPTTAQQPFFSNLGVADDQLAALQYQHQHAQVAYQQQHQMMAQAQAQAAQQQLQQLQLQQQAAAYSRDAQTGQAYAAQGAAVGATRQETNAYIDRYALVAEAAKRAQMAVLERDLGAVELG